MKTELQQLGLIPRKQSRYEEVIFLYLSLHMMTIEVDFVMNIIWSYFISFHFISFHFISANNNMFIIM